MPLLVELGNKLAPDHSAAPTTTTFIEVLHSWPMRELDLSLIAIALVPIGVPLSP
jgi:hypothetical protein